MAAVHQCPPTWQARRAKAYAQKFPSFHVDDLNHIVAKAYANGNKNPKAHMHKVSALSTCRTNV